VPDGTAGEPGSRVTDPERRYTDEQVALILRRAARLDAGPDVPEAGEGLTLPEIERIAREVGIAPDLVMRAAAAVDAGASGGAAARFFGGPEKFEAQYEARGELTRERYGDVVEAIRRVMGKSGAVSEVLDGLEWKSVGETTQVTVLVRPAAGRTRVQILADRGGSALLAFLFPGMGALIGGAIAGAVIDPGVSQGIAIMGTAAAAGLATGRTIWAAATRRFRRKFAALVDAVTTQVEQCRPTQTGPSRNGSPSSDEPDALPPVS